MTWKATQKATASIAELRKDVEKNVENSRERALALTKLEEAEHWLGALQFKQEMADDIAG